jgi:ribonuclease E
VTTDEAQSTAEQSSGQPDYDEADFTDELPAAAVDEAKAVDEVAQEETPPTQDLPDVSAVAPREVQEDFPDASEEMAIEVEPPQPGQAAAEATPPASEGPKTEDQYEDDEGYFDDQDSESTAPAAVPSLEIPAPAAAATEDDYEEYENEDYGEEDKPSDTPRADPAPSSTRSEPPASAREEIEEVADGPEETEDEAYADEQDEYEDDEAAASRGNSPRAKKDQPPAQVEASADEYEEEDEEYAEDEIEDSSPSPASKSKPAAAAPPAKSDDEMDEEVGYDSEYGSDG